MRRNTSRIDTSPHGTAATPAPAKGVEPTEAEIRERAYAKYLVRRSTSNDPLADWLDAERELCEEKKRVERPFVTAKSVSVVAAGRLDDGGPPGDRRGRTASAGVDS